MTHHAASHKVGGKPKKRHGSKTRSSKKVLAVHKKIVRKTSRK